MFRHRCTPSERLLALVNELQHGEGTITSGIRCRGILDADKLRESLARLQARHPKLRARIEFDAQQWPHFVEMNPVAPISCEFREIADTSAAERVLLHEWTDRFPADVSPPVRLVVLHCPDENCTDIVGWFHHSAFYGAAIWQFFLELIQAYSDPQACREPADGGFDVTPKGRTGALGDLYWYAKLLWFRVVMGWLKPTVTFNDRTPLDLCYVREVMSAESTRRLVEACRREKVSVSSALSAAACMIYAREFNWHGRLIAMPTARDARSELAPPLSNDTLGCFATVYQVVMPLPGRDEEFWGYARRLTDEAQRQYAWKDPVRGIRLIKIVPLRAVIRGGTNRSVLILNNLGRASFGDAPHMPELLDYYGHGRAKSFLTSGVTLTAITTNDRLALTLTTACFDRADVTRMLHEIEAFLGLSADPPRSESHAAPRTAPAGVPERN